MDFCRATSSLLHFPVLYFAQQVSILISVSGLTNALVVSLIGVVLMDMFEGLSPESIASQHKRFILNGFVAYSRIVK